MVGQHEVHITNAMLMWRCNGTGIVSRTSRRTREDVHLIGPKCAVERSANGSGASAMDIV